MLKKDELYQITSVILQNEKPNMWHCMSCWNPSLLEAMPLDGLNPLHQEEA